MVKILSPPHESYFNRFFINKFQENLYFFKTFGAFGAEIEGFYGSKIADFVKLGSPLLRVGPSQKIISDCDSRCIFINLIYSLVHILRYVTVPIFSLFYIVLLILLVLYFSVDYLLGNFCNLACFRFLTILISRAEEKLRNLIQNQN